LHLISGGSKFSLEIGRYQRTCVLHGRGLFAASACAFNIRKKENKAK